MKVQRSDNGDSSDQQSVVITGIDISFFDIVGFLVKCSIACIPAAIILYLLGMAFSALFYAVGSGIRH